MPEVNLQALTNNDLIKVLSHKNPILGYFMTDKTCGRFNNQAEIGE